MSAESPSSRSAPGAGSPLRAAALDGVLIVVFVLIGRVSHGEDLSIGGVAATAWPFLVGAALGWVLSLAWRRPYALARTGIPVWVVTVAAGMVLRHTSGQGVAVSFVVVAAVVLGILLIGWRGIAAVVRRSRRRSAVAPAAARSEHARETRR